MESFQSLTAQEMMGIEGGTAGPSNFAFTILSALIGSITKGDSLDSIVDALITIFIDPFTAMFNYIFNTI